jgi:hypothetical protein
MELLAGGSSGASILSEFRMSRYSSFDGILFHVLRHKELQVEVRIPATDVDQLQVGLGLGFIEAVERLLLGARCMSCWADLLDGQVGLCGSCFSERLEAVLVARGRIDEGLDGEGLLSGSLVPVERKVPR